jgi:hypothetical protein
LGGFLVSNTIHLVVYHLVLHAPLAAAQIQVA